MVSYFDHATKTVPRPTVLLDKQTNDAHDNPVISIDDQGYIWIFSTSHGTSRPSFIHRSKRPFEIDEFERVEATRPEAISTLPINNFSYMQAWHVPNRGFAYFFTKYRYPAPRTICFSSSQDGQRWTTWQRIAAIAEGHYQISGLGKERIATVFNYHPRGKGLNWRTNLYYVESTDLGRTWQTAAGEQVTLPIVDVEHASQVRDYQQEGLKIYLKDIGFDELDRPVILYLASKGYQSGPVNDPRTWMIARWDGGKWRFSPITTSDNNYDMGSLWIESTDDWRVIAPTETGPQAYNPGGEVAMWQSRDAGAGWHQLAQLTAGSQHNHTYVRRPVNAHPDFYAIWADGHGRQPSESQLYFANRRGDVYRLPHQIEGAFASPMRISISGDK